ncbi:MAG: RT0821/Lpp0805 family surface protein [Alphaproteobacteria bacterium]|nr:RT0821/Lpp0805 family surface protein [Alphaproteobacteria bacterium]
MGTCFRFAAVVVVASLGLGSAISQAHAQAMSESTGIFGSQGVDLDKEDIELLRKAARNALDNLENGKRADWSNPKTGSHGLVVPTSRYESQGLPCRELHLFVTPRGKGGARHFRLPMCKVSDGQWRIAF